MKSVTIKYQAKEQYKKVGDMTIGETAWTYFDGIKHIILRITHGFVSLTNPQITHNRYPDWRTVNGEMTPPGCEITMITE